MKNVITILMCAFCLVRIMAQNADGPGRAVPQATPEIIALYAQQRDLKASGNIAGLEANRQAIIAAWQAVDPTIAAEFKPNQANETEQFSPEAVQKKLNIPYNNTPAWGGDLELDTDFIDGVDLDTALDGTIYVAAYENRMRYGLGNDYINQYKSIDNGVSFSLTSVTTIPRDITKIKLTLMDKGATKYLFITYSSVEGVLKNLRHEIGGGGGFEGETIATDVKEFDIDVDYEFVAAAQLYAVYTKTDNTLYSARSEANSTGFGWGDEHNFNLVARECAFTYGKGNTYMSFIGFNTGSLFFASNTGFNNPAGWNSPIQLTDGAVRESSYISMSAERRNFSDYRALVLASQRPAGSFEDFIGTVNIVQQGIAFPEDIEISAGNIIAWDSWCRKEDDNKIIKTSFETFDEVSCRIKNYNDAVWDASELISDNPITVQRGSSAVAEDADGNAIAVYIGANRTGLYFDTNNPLGVGENALSGFVYYPNPANSTVNIKATSTINNVAIYNLLGQQVLNQKLDALSSEINVSGLSSGTYVMKVTIGNEIGSYKIIKN